MRKLNHCSTEKFLLNPKKLNNLWGTFLKSVLFGCEDKIGTSLYICWLSAFIIIPLYFFAKSIAKDDFPEAVGPAIINILNLFSLFIFNNTDWRLS